ncbi:FAD-binding oxidoreductase, partial [Candidatus Poribacteria bacterium]|nr:FAD-binding oxidoreductase [Candidatus Poribacteria bacterium]
MYIASAKTKHIAVVGAGVIGVSIAYFLSRRPNTVVTVFEQDVPGAGASGHSFAWVNAYGKDPREYHTLNRRSLDMWYRLAHQLNADIGVHYGGEMRWENRTDKAIQLKNRTKQLQNWGYPCSLISTEEMLDLEPDMMVDSAKAISHSEADIHVETDKFISVCLKHAIDSGGTLHAKTAVTGLVMHNRKIATVQTQDTEFRCDAVVLASGIQTTELASLVDIHVPQQRSPGIVIKTTPCVQVLHNVAVIHA